MNHLPDRIIVAGMNADMLTKLAALFSMIGTKTAIDETVTTANFIFITLQPLTVVDAIKVITPTPVEKSTIVSLTPKIITTMINRLSGGKNPVIRMMPNARSLVREGYNPIPFGPGGARTRSEKPSRISWIRPEKCRKFLKRR